MHYEVLLVDDEKSVTKALKRVLKNDFAEVHEAQSASQALQTLKNHQIDIVISDYCMPDVNGSQFLSEVHRRYPAILNLMLSGQADMEGFSKALNEGYISKFLCKPWDNKQLKQFVIETIKEHESTLSTDKLTGLSSYNMFIKQIKHLGLDEFNGACVALLNIRRFTDINEHYGIKGGNAVLKRIAKRMQLLFPERIQARIKDDVFAIVLQDETQISKETKDLLRVFNTAVEFENSAINVSGTIGITTIADWKGEHATNIERNLNQMATLASEVHPIIFCNPESHDAWFKNATLVSELQSAIKLNQLTLHYQPQIDLKHQRVVGCEALLRWFHPRRGLLSPSDFIPMIERYDMADNLLQMILTQAFQYMSTESKLFEDIRMSINLFASQLDNPNLATLILSQLKQYGLSPNSLELEITETSLVKSYDKSREQLATLRDAGVKIAIDDFGSGYASYEYLCELPIDVVKIDGGFIKGMYSNIERATALNTIVATANILSLEVVAECVEGENQANVLTDMGCKRLQGYWFSKPLNWKDFINFTLLYNDTEIFL